MTLNLQLSSDAEAKLRERAAAAGQDVHTFVLEAVEDRLAAEPPDSDRAARRSGDHRAWLEKLQAWTALHPVVSHFVDDNREYIYGDRGNLQQ